MATGEPSGGPEPGERPSRRRGPWRLTVGALVAAAACAAGAIAVIAVRGGGDQGPALRGANPSDPPVPAPLVTGTDSTGRAVRLPTPGRPAVVTFLYTSCPTVCPVIARRLSRALDRLPARVARRIDVVAVSVDPRGDTPAAAAAFLRTHRLTGRMRYVIGNRAALAPIWRAWHVAAQPAGAGASLHTGVIVLVDGRGRRVGIVPGGAPIRVDDLTADLRAIAAD